MLKTSSYMPGDAHHLLVHRTRIRGCPPGAFRPRGLGKCSKSSSKGAFSSFFIAFAAFFFISKAFEMCSMASRPPLAPRPTLRARNDALGSPNCAGEISRLPTHSSFKRPSLSARFGASREAAKA